MFALPPLPPPAWCWQSVMSASSLCRWSHPGWTLALASVLSALRSASHTSDRFNNGCCCRHIHLTEWKCANELFVSLSYVHMQIFRCWAQRSAWEAEVSGWWSSCIMLIIYFTLLSYLKPADWTTCDVFYKDLHLSSTPSPGNDIYLLLNCFLTYVMLDDVQWWHQSVAVMYSWIKSHHRLSLTLTRSCVTQNKTRKQFNSAEVSGAHRALIDRMKSVRWENNHMVNYVDRSRMQRRLLPVVHHNKRCGGLG